MKPILLLYTLTLLLTACTTTPVSNGSSANLDTWITQELTPYLLQELGHHPKFKGSPLVLVKMNDADVEPDIDALTEDIRDRLFNRLLSEPGINMVWQPTTLPWRHHRKLSELHCNDFSRTQHYIGIDIKSYRKGEARISVRALNMKDSSWVSGFSKSWTGVLTSEQQQALGERHSDEYLRGLRPLPFNSQQADLAAAYLAHNLSCLLQARGIADVVIYHQLTRQKHGFFQTTQSLISNYLNQFQEVRVTENRNDANVMINTEVHPINDDLFQLWAVTRFKQSGEHISGSDTAVYVSLGRNPKPERSDISPDPTGRMPHLISRFDVIVPISSSFCQSDRPWAQGERLMIDPGRLISGSCLALEVEPSESAWLFLIHEEESGTMKRLVPSSCSNQPSLVDAYGSFRFPPLGEDESMTIELDNRPGQETFSVIAASHPDTARQIKELIEQIPDACAGLGYRVETSEWKSQLDQLVDRFPREIQIVERVIWHNTIR